MTTPDQPPTSKAKASKSCDSHSFAIHGLSKNVYEKLSAWGNSRCCRIHCPVRICQNVSGSRRTYAGMKITIDVYAMRKRISPTYPKSHFWLLFIIEGIRKIHSSPYLTD